MRATFRWGAALAALLAAAGCGNDFPDPSVIEELRILGMRAEAPELQPGQSTTVSVLAVTPEESNITYSWRACAPRAGVEEAQDQVADNVDELRCEGAPDVVDLGTGETAEVTVPADYLQRPGAEDLAQIRALYYVVEVTAETDADLEVTRRVSVKRLVVTPAGGSIIAEAPNRNPTLVGLRNVSMGSDAEDPFRVATLPVVKPEGFERTNLLIEVVFDADEQEPYLDLVVGNSTGCNGPEVPGLGCVSVLERTELFYWHWYTTEEGLLHLTTDSEFNRAVYRQPKRRKIEGLDDPGDSKTVPLWIVMRDGRGGTDWMTTQFEIFVSADEAE